jgi:hypothetical protein
MFLITCRLSIPLILLALTVVALAGSSLTRCPRPQRPRQMRKRGETRCAIDACATQHRPKNELSRLWGRSTNWSTRTNVPGGGRARSLLAVFKASFLARGIDRAAS